MDFHAAMETFAEAWVAANTPTAVNTDAQNTKTTPDNLPTLVHKDPVKHTTDSQPSSHSPDNSGSGAKSLPIHCVIEQTSGPLTFESHEGSPHTTVELDSYAILPSTTLFSELVRAALMKLGYSSTEAMNSKGAVQIKNWKPLTFDVITNDTKATVDDILGELTQVATLRIRLCSSPDLVTPTRWTDNTVRCAVMSLLKEMSQSTLAKLCPLTQSAISNIANWKYSNKLSEEKCREFGMWYLTYTKQSKDFPGEGTPKDSRQTFHPQHEISLMRQWYKTCKHPTEDKLKFFAEELNRGHVRQERPKVTISKLKIWWKNERQREKRNEQKKTQDDKNIESTAQNQSQNIPSNENITVEDVNAQEQNMENERLKLPVTPTPMFRHAPPEHRLPLVNQPFAIQPNPFIYGTMIGHPPRHEQPFCHPEG